MGRARGGQPAIFQRRGRSDFWQHIPPITLFGFGPIEKNTNHLRMCLKKFFKRIDDNGRFLNVAIEAGVMVADVQCSTGAILGRVHVPKFKIRKSAFEHVRVEMEVVARFKRSVFPRTRLDLCFKMIHFARGMDTSIVSN